jgi:hypothetical protein
VLAPRGMGGLGNVRLCSCLLALLATLLLVVPSFLALLLLLATAAGESPYQALRLVGYSSDGVLSSLDSLPSLVGYLARSILCFSALLLLRLA